MTDDETLLQMAERHNLAKEHAKAFAIWQRLANRGNAIAQAKLGGCYYTATGTEKDTGKAAYWFAKAAARRRIMQKPSTGLQRLWNRV